MNRCEEVLAKRKNPLRSNETLKHSETYMGVEFTEDLTHWKYIKKYKNSKGKTVYVYANNSKHQDIENKNHDRERDRRASEQYEAHASVYSKALRDLYKYPNASGKQFLHEVQIGLLGNRLYKKSAEEKDKQYDYLLENNSVKNVIKNTTKKAVIAVKEIHADAVKRGTRFIEKLLSKA